MQLEGKLVGLGFKSKYGGFGHGGLQCIRRADLVHNAKMFQGGGGGLGESEVFGEVLL